MPERRFDDGYWDDPFVQRLSRDSKLLYPYLWTNKHCNPAGLYQITPSTIAFETKIAEADIPQLFEELAPKVVWYRDENLVWVKNFIKWQTLSPKFLVAVARCLKTINNNGAVKDLLEYNEERYGFLIPYQRQHISLDKRECVLIRDNFICQYCGKEITESTDFEMDHVLPVTRGGKDHYPNLAASCHTCNQKKLDKTPEEAGLPNPNPSSFHHAQAIYLLKNNEELRNKWVSVFPDRLDEVDLILGNVDQYYSTLKSQKELSSISSSLSRSNSDKGKEVVKGKGEKSTTEESISPSESEIEESLSEGDRKVISVWRSVKGFSMPIEEAAELVARLRTEFPDVDILAESKTWAARKLSEPLKQGSRPSSQIWNWMRKAREFAQERSKGERQHGAHRQSDREPTAEELRQSVE